jgi:DNA-binding transcriptional MerR regulator
MEPELTIDELAARTRVPSRTIRYYQALGLLPAPRLQGRVAHYGADHIKRLELIAHLQDRGLRNDAIRALLERVNHGDVDVGEWLGLETELATPWGDDRPRTVTRAELEALLGERRPGLVHELVRAGVLERKGEVFGIESPALLRIALELDLSGIAPESASQAETILRKHLARAAAELAEYFFDEAKHGHVTAVDGGRELFKALRHSGMEAVRTVFAREMEGVLREWAESGRAARKTRPRRPRKR